MTLGNIILNLPSGANYSQNQVDQEDMSIKYPYAMYSKNQFEYCRKQSFKIFKPINSKHGKTTLTTSTSKGGLSHALINNK